MDSESEPVRALAALRADVQRTAHLRALWEKFGKAPSNTGGAEMGDRDFRDAEMLLRAPEFRVQPDVIAQLINRLTAYFAADRSLGEFIADVRLAMPLDRRPSAWRISSDPFIVRHDLRAMVAGIPLDPGRAHPDAFVGTPDDPFGMLDSDARDAAFSRIPELPTSAARRDATLRALDIDANATIAQREQFALDPEDRAAIFRAAAERAPDVLPPYLPQLAEDAPVLARELLDAVIAHDLLAGADAIDRFPLAPEERGERERALVAAHPTAAIVHRAELARFLVRTTVDDAMSVAFAHLERDLPPAPVERLTALDALTERDADISDHLTPVIRASLTDAIASLREGFHALRRDIAEIRKVPIEQVGWADDLFDWLSWDTKPYDSESTRVARFQRELGSPRVRSLLLSAFALDAGERFVAAGRASLAETEQRAIVEEALARNRILGPEGQDEWTGWSAFAHPPRTVKERETVRAFLHRLAAVSPTDFAVAVVEATRTGDEFAEYLPMLRRVSPEHLEQALYLTDDHGRARIFAHADRATAKEVVDAIFGMPDASADAAHLVSHIPSAFQSFLLPHIARYRTEGAPPYAVFPDAPLALRALAIGTTFTDGVADLPESDRAVCFAEFRSLATRHRSRGMRAAASIAHRLDGDALRRGALRTIRELLDEIPGAWLPLPREGEAKATLDDARWNALAAFIPYCSPDRIRELLDVWEPRMARATARTQRARQRERDARTQPSSETLLLAFRLREHPQRLIAQHPILTARDASVTVHDIAHARNPKALLAFIEERSDELAEFLADRGTRGRFVEYLASAYDPADAWAFVRRFADSYGTMVPEAERRAAITREMVLRETASRLLTGSVRFLLDEQHEVPVAHAGAAQFANPIIRDGRLALHSLTAPELERLIRDRLTLLFAEDPEDRLRADAENRALAEGFRAGTAVLPEGTLVHYTGAGTLPAILAEANCCGETIGIESAQDSFPLFVDALRIREQDGPFDVPKLLAHPEYHAAFSSFDRGAALVYPRRSHPSARFPGEEMPASHRLDIHSLSFIGIPNSELGAIVLTEAVADDAFDDVLEQTKAAVVQSGMYVPIVRATGELCFPPEEYDARESASHPYRTLADLLADDAALDALDRPQPSAAHEFTLKEHLRTAERHAHALAEALAVPPEYRARIRVAARLHDIGKFEAAATGQEIANVVAAERELAKVRDLDPETKRQILVLIRHDELLGHILQGTTLDADGTAACTPEADRAIAEFHDRFPLPLHRTLMRVLYQADVRAVGNRKEEEWQVREKLAALESRLFPRTPNARR